MVKLNIELIPRSTWFSNLRKHLTPQEWEKVKRHTFSKARYKCEICKDTGINQGYYWPVECHEIFEYDEALKVQRLIGTIALCPKCHKVKHIGLAQIHGEFDMCVEHIMAINKMTEEEAYKFIEEAFSLWRKRNEINWTVNLDWIKNII